ncbi:MAG: hypothetical protein ACKO0W_05890 [Planctomycetota bacterium]
MKCMACVVGASAVVASAALAGEPVQWPVSAGGNGHWYAKVQSNSTISWTAAKAQAEALGGQLSCHETAAENQYVWQYAVQPTFQNWDAWIGLQKVGGQWRWLTGPATYTSWTFNSPDGDCGGANYAHFHQNGPTWNDISENGIYCYNQSTSTCGTGRVCSFLVEWSADCNGDGLVDFGQIRSGQLADSNADNVPDVCQCASGGVVRVPQDAPSIAAAVALACPTGPLEIVLAPGTWPMSIDTGDPSKPITIRGLDQTTCVVTTPGAGGLLNARYGSPVLLKNLTVADLVSAPDLSWETYFDGCIVRNCAGSFRFDSGASPHPAALATRFESCTSASSGVLDFGSSETIDGCEFIDCTRAISLWGASTISNCSFAGTDVYGVQGGASFSMSGCDFTGTTGSAIEQSATMPSVANLSGCSFVGGSTWAIRDVVHDPGVLAPSHTWSLVGCSFEGNAGSMQFGRNRSVTLDDCQFSSNSPANIEQSQTFVGSFVASNCAFTDNEAGIGAAYACSSVNEARFTNCTFTGNRSVFGGALWAEYSRCFVTDCVFAQNSASSGFWESGGAIEIVLGTAVISGCDFVGNTAPYGSGGAIACNNVNLLYFNDLPLRIEDCDFVGNSAAYYGGAVYFHGANLAGIEIAGCRFDHNGALGGTAVMAYDVNFDIKVSGCAVSNEGPASTFRVIDGTGAYAGMVVGTSSVCAGSPRPFVGAVDDGTNCIAVSCDDLDGNGRPDECDLYLDVPAQFATIQAAINAVPAGARRIVRVAPGVYNESFSLNGKNVLVRGAAGGATILDGAGLATSIARFTGGEPATAGLESLVFRNATSGSVPHKGAAYRVGGAVYGFGSSARVRDCRFEDNRSDFGGAMYLILSTLDVSGCEFVSNEGVTEGGGALVYQCTGVVSGCEFLGNSCGLAGPGSGSGFKAVGALGAGQEVVLSGCTFTGNTANLSGSAVEFYENLESTSGRIRLVDTVIAGNASGLGAPSGAAGLRVIGTLGCATIGADVEICGNSPRNISGPYLVAAPFVSCDCEADITGDGLVNGADLGVLLGSWGLANAQGTGDLNHDGLVTGADLTLVLGNWGGCQ